MQEEEESNSTSQKRKNDDKDRWNGVFRKVGRKKHVAEEDGEDDVQEFGGKEKTEESQEFVYSRDRYMGGTRLITGSFNLGYQCFGWETPIWIGYDCT